MKKYDKLRAIAKQSRIDCLEMTYKAKSSHIGSCFSIIEILVILYFKFLKKEDKNNFIMSKGHAAAALYSILSLKKFFKRSLLKNYCSNGFNFSGHVNHKINGVFLSTGALGHGLPVASGIAITKKKKNKKIFVLISDGECDEGTTWESALFASHNNLNNLIVIVDYNKIQSFGNIKDILNLEPIEAKWKSFNWFTQRINGHNFNQLDNAIKKSLKSKKPSVIICDTIKGKGVSFMEHKLKWHYKNVNNNELIHAKREINKL